MAIVNQHFSTLSAKSIEQINQKATNDNRIRKVKVLNIWSICFALVKSILLLLLIILGLGEVEILFLALQPTLFIFVYIVILAFILLPLIELYRNTILQKVVPYKLGLYMTPIELIDIQTDIVQIRSLSDVVDIRAKQSDGVIIVYLVFEDTVEKLYAKNTGDLETIINRISIAKSLGVRAGLINIIHAESTNEITSDTTDIKNINLIYKTRWTIVFLIGACTFLARNTISNSIIASNLETTSSEHIHEYKLKLVDSWYGSPEKMLQIEQSLAEAELREALEAESIIMLIRFKETHTTRTDLINQANEALHKFYIKAFEDFKSQASLKDPSLIPFFEELITWLEKNDTATVTLSFKGITPDMLTQVDAAVDAEYHGRYTRPDNGNNIGISKVQHGLKIEDSAKREQIIANILEDGFKKVIPQEIMVLSIEEPNEDLPAMTIEYDVKPLIQDNSISIYRSEKDLTGDAFIGLQFNFKISMNIPNSNTSFSFTVEVDPPNQFHVSQSSLVLSKSLETVMVYDTMAIKAFENLITGIRDTFFAVGSKGYDSINFPERQMLSLLYVQYLLNETSEVQFIKAPQFYEYLTGEVLSEEILRSRIKTVKTKSSSEIANNLKALSNEMSPNNKKMVLKGVILYLLIDETIDDDETAEIGRIMELLQLKEEDLNSVIEGGW